LVASDSLVPNEKCALNVGYARRAHNSKPESEAKMTRQSGATIEDNEQNALDGLPDMCTPTQLHKAGFGSKGLIYKILKSPDGPAYVKLGKKTLIDKREWRRYLESKTVRREVIDEEADAA
jgi:hypothetical protein